MKNIFLCFIMIAAAGCSTVEQAKKDFKNFKTTIILYNFPTHYETCAYRDVNSEQKNHK